MTNLIVKEKSSPYTVLVKTKNENERQWRKEASMTMVDGFSFRVEEEVGGRGEVV
jgi:hypothetical protein